MIKISVIIPCYNAGLYIDRCIRTITVQTIGFDNLEIICIDDASTDDTWDHLQKWEQRFPDNILLIRQKENRKQGTARNIGLQYASADWIAFIDADDWLEPDYFEQLYKPVLKYVCDVVCCDFSKDISDTIICFEENSKNSGMEEGDYIFADSEDVKKWLIKNKGAVISPLGMIIRKILLVDYSIFFPEDLVYEDRFWGPLLFTYAQGVYFVKKRLYHYYLNPHSTTHLDNADFFVDWATIQLMKQKEYEKRGLMQKYREELEYDSLLDAVRMMLLLCGYENPSFSLYQLERQIITEYIPDYKTNRYFSDFQGVSRSILEALYAPLDKEGFHYFEQMIKHMKIFLKELQTE